MLKFKVWDNVGYMSKPFTLQDLQAGRIKFTEDCKVLQFTGLSDRNNKFYCEGDLVLYEGKVYKLFRGTYAFELDGFYEPSQDVPSDFFGESAWIKGTIIGNIYETPELLNNK